MARSKPYTAKLAVLDVILILITGGLWLVVMLVRELMRRS